MRQQLVCRAASEPERCVGGRGEEGREARKDIGTLAVGRLAGRYVGRVGSSAPLMKATHPLALMNGFLQ